MLKQKVMLAAIPLLGMIVVLIIADPGPLKSGKNDRPTRPINLVLTPDTTLFLGLSASDTLGTVMVYVPAGCFTMGRGGEVSHNYFYNPFYDPFYGGDPFQMCFTKGYWIDKLDATNADYQKFIDAGGYDQQGDWWSNAGWNWVKAIAWHIPEDYPGFTDPQQPRVGEQWYEAYAYCKWRGGRLPTEPEWEYAARGPKNLIYPWGNTFDSAKVVYGGNSNDSLAVVGSNPDNASWVGALDMEGNVSQWTSTIYDNSHTIFRYPYPITNDGRERQDVSNAQVIIRGESWVQSDPLYFRTFVRWAVPAVSNNYYRQIDIGFRCVRDE